MAVTISTLRAQLILDTENFLNGFAKADLATKSFASGIGGRLSSIFKGIGSSASSLIGSMGGVSSVFSSIGAQISGTVLGLVGVHQGVVALGRGMDQVDRQAKLADRLGITVAEVQKLSLAAHLAGTDVELLAKSMLRMGKNIGSGGMTLDQRLFAVADSISKIKDAGIRAKQAHEIFGKGGLEIINVLIQGGRGIRNSADAIDKFGLAMSRVDAAKIEASIDAWTEMKTVIGGLRNELLVSFAPKVTSFIDLWLRGLEQLRNRQDALNASIRQAGKETNTWGDYALALIAQDNPIAFIAHGPDGAIRFGQVLEGLIKQREDAMRNAANSGRQGGAALLGRAFLGGGTGTGSKFSAAHERGSIGAASVIANANNANPFDKAIKPAVDKLTLIERHTAAAARRATREPLRPSRISGRGR